MQKKNPCICYFQTDRQSDYFIDPYYPFRRDYLFPFYLSVQNLLSKLHNLLNLLQLVDFRLDLEVNSRFSKSLTKLFTLRLLPTLEDLLNVVLREHFAQRMQDVKSRKLDHIVRVLAFWLLYFGTISLSAYIKSTDRTARPSAIGYYRPKSLREIFLSHLRDCCSVQMQPLSLFPLHLTYLLYITSMEPPQFLCVPDR